MSKILTSPFFRYPKSLWSYNPIPRDCVLYLPLWNSGLRGDVVKSIDPFGHVATVSGALFQGDQKGRFFDGGTGNDDEIVIPQVSSINNLFDGGGTVIAWINAASDGGGNLGSILHKSLWGFIVKDEAAGAVKLFFDQQFTGDDYTAQSNATVVTLNQNTQVAITYDNSATGNNAIIYVDASPVAITEGTPTGTRNSDASVDLYTGNHPTVARVFDGNIIEVSGWNRILTADEITYHRRMSRRNL